MYIILSEQCIFSSGSSGTVIFFLEKIAPPEQYNSFNIGSAERVQFFFFYNGSARAMYFLKKWHHWSSAIF